MVMPPLVVFFLWLLHAASGARWENDWDDKLEFTCPAGQGIYMIETDGNFGYKGAGNKNDRKWGFDCKSMGASQESGNCKWYTGIDQGSWLRGKDWVNNFRENFEVECPNNGILAGLKSIHDNKYEDRIWNVYCCTGDHQKVTDCGWRIPTEKSYGEDDWKFEFGEDESERSFIRGVKSTWVLRSYKKVEGGNYYKLDQLYDRNWEFQVCKKKFCSPSDDLNKHEKRTPVEAKKGTREVNSVSTSLNCNSRHTIEFEEGPETIQTNSVEITDTKGQESSTTSTASFSVGVEVETSGPTVSMEAGGSIDTTKSTSTEETNSKTYSSSSTTYAVQFDWFTGPSAMMIMSESDTYEFTDNNYNVTEYLQCEGEDPKPYTRTISIAVKSYGQTHFTTRYAKFKSEKDCIANQVAVEACFNNLRLMKGENEAIGEAFEACFAKKDSSGNVLYSDKTNRKGKKIPLWIDGIVERGVRLRY